MNSQECTIQSVLANDQHFPDMVAGKKKLDRSEIVEQILDVTIVEDSLQPESTPDRWMDWGTGTSLWFFWNHHVLNFQRVGSYNVVAVAWRIGAGITRVEKGQQHATRFER